MLNKLLKSIILKVLLLIQCLCCVAAEESKDSSVRYFEYLDASVYTHLNWSETRSEKISLNLKPIINYSGIPIEDRLENAEYFNYGKLPYILNNIYLDAFTASRVFDPTLSIENINQSEYQVELIIDQYKLPFKYSADDLWWKKLHAQTDRWLQKPGNTGVKLTIKVKSGSNKIRPWTDSIKMVLSNCDLNAFPQPQTSGNNKDQLSEVYLSTVPGQTFLAATNFLVLKTIQRLKQQPLHAKVIGKFEDEISLESQYASFHIGQVLDLFYNDAKTGKSEVLAGKIKIIHTSDNLATAYPISLRSDHITIGDWVEIPQPNSFEKPASTFIARNSCADVSTSTAVAAH